MFPPYACSDDNRDDTWIKVRGIKKPTSPSWFPLCKQRGNKNQSGFLHFQEGNDPGDSGYTFVRARFNSSHGLVSSRFFKAMGVLARPPSLGGATLRSSKPTMTQ
jgi:hypothetical protein